MRTPSGATAVQIAEYAGGGQRIVKHVGSAHTEAELGVLLARARELLEDSAQGVLDLDVEPAPPVARLVAPGSQPALFEGDQGSPVGGRDGPGRVVGTDCRVLFEALTGVYTDLGFDVVGDEVFRDLVLRPGRGVDLATGRWPGAEGPRQDLGQILHDETHPGPCPGRWVPRPGRQCVLHPRGHQ